MRDQIVSQYRRMASAMEELRSKRRPQVRYHLLADGIYWSDEIPNSLEHFAESCLRIILRYRTSLIVGDPDRKWEPYWQAAERQFPKWIGFMPARTSPNAELAAIFHSLRADAGKLFEKATDRGVGDTSFDRESEQS